MTCIEFIYEPIVKKRVPQRSLDNLVKVGIFKDPEIARAAQRKGVEAKRRKKQRVNDLKDALATVKSLMKDNNKDLQEVSAVEVVKALAINMINTGDASEGGKLMMQVAAFETAKPVAQSKVVITDERELSDEELLEIIKDQTSQETRVS